MFSLIHNYTLHTVAIIHNTYVRKFQWEGNVNMGGVSFILKIWIGKLMMYSIFNFQGPLSAQGTTCFLPFFLKDASLSRKTKFR